MEETLSGKRSNIQTVTYERTDTEGGGEFSTKEKETERVCI